MGAVYRARDLHFPNVVKLVAVKEMINQARDPLVRSTIVRNFEREANLLATLDHPAIPRIYDYFTHNERSYLILEFSNGKDLEAILGDFPPFSEARLYLSAFVLEAQQHVIDAVGCAVGVIVADLLRIQRRGFCL